MEKDRSKPVKMPAPEPVEYRALTGVSYSGNHFNAGDTLVDLPADSVGWLLAQNCIEKVGK